MGCAQGLGGAQTRNEADRGYAKRACLQNRSVLDGRAPSGWTARRLNPKGSRARHYVELKSSFAQ